MTEGTAADADGSERTEVGAMDDQRKSRLRRRTRTGVPIWVRAVTALVFLVLAGAIAFLSQTAPGQGLVVNESPAGIADHWQQAMSGWGDFQAFMAWAQRCETLAQHSGNVVNSLWQ
jgi:hypothetical protein